MCSHHHQGPPASHSFPFIHLALHLFGIVSVSPIVVVVPEKVVDERMWGDEDKPEPDQDPGQEQRRKDAPAQVHSLADSNH